MRVISRKAPHEFAKRYPDAKAQLDAWYHEAKKASWESPVQIKEMYGKASILKNSRVVFDICGNKYRIVVRANLQHGILFIRFVGTHKEYDKSDAEEV